MILTLSILSFLAIYRQQKNVLPYAHQTSHGHTLVNALMIARGYQYDK
jgi:hypothetical protein